MTRSVDPRIAELRDLGSTIADDVYFGPEVYIEQWFAPLLTIESGVVLSQGTTILLHDSSLNNVAGADVLIGEVILRENCYIGANSTILCGVEIGAGALVGACSLVLRDIPADSVAFGSPARVAGSVQMLVASQAERHPSTARTRLVPARPWRQRSDDEHAALHSRIDAAIEQIRSDREA